MKKFYTFLAITAFTAIAANAQENLITNGDFEIWTDVTPEGFKPLTASSGVMYNDLITKSTDKSVSGNAVKQQSKVEGTTQYLEYSNLITVIPGHSYTFSYSYYDNDNAARSRMWSSWLDSDTKALTTQGSIQEADTNFSTDIDAWQTKTITATAPAGAVKLRFQTRVNSQGKAAGGYIYYDNLSVVDNGVAGVKQNQIADLKLFPNPLTGNVLNVATGNNVEKSVAVFDVLGKQVINTKTVNGTVNTGNLTAGVYVVKITEEGKTATRKLIVQ